MTDTNTTATGRHRGRRLVCPHRDTISTMLEVADSMPAGDSMRSKLEVAADRLQCTECAASPVPDHDALVARIMRDWDVLSDEIDPATRERMADAAANAAVPALVAIEHQQHGDVPIGATIDVAIRRAREVVLRKGDWTLDWQDLDALLELLDRLEPFRGVIPEEMRCAVRVAHGAHVYLCANGDGPGRPADRTCPGRSS